ncbi:hypothetical protein [Ktedonospora formicarum]|uniref:Uncharacterized protein n=1 Tax=Ktedonospora formicarum TaxID=2778364 RepID=A0A8J3I1R0_9CHLR|nr:hypothetical protein [Ktedonospora formicarum]GHO43314.1 hypothetical protein KSX_14770 [Ktedonospora formicarum]
MQRVYARNKSKTASSDLRQDNDILHFSLQDALPQGHIMALNPKFGTLSYLAYDDDRLLMVAQEQFTGTEMSVLLPLLEMFPYYCPYEALYASFYNGRISEETVEQSRKKLDEALEEGLWDQEMRPIRDALSRTRIKLKKFGIDVSSILATGYILMVASAPMPIIKPRESEREMVNA